MSSTESSEFSESSEFFDEESINYEVPSLEKLTFNEICRQLNTFVAGKKASASFACGGLVSIGTKKPAPGFNFQPVSVSLPVRVWWCKDGHNTLRTVTLPLDSNADSKSASDDLHQLVVDCDTASFGRGKEEVIDPQYRKAGKLEPQNFLTSFHPADFGILQNLEQILLPNFNTDKQNSLPFRKLSAELYKLNVYSAPSGLFRKHVDTPRCPSQIGSLVVCLPSHFKGGNLAVRHEGKQVDFDWSHQSASAIQWAAFYSDCEHEIETITEGDRITLTYNLYATEPAGGSIPPSLIVDPKIFPLYSFLKELIIQPGFMKKGGALGFYCSHAYPHASNEAEKLLPRALKGADLVLYSVFKSLGIYIEVLPVIPEGYYYRPNRSKVRIGDELCPFIITGTRDDTVDVTGWDHLGGGKYRPEITWIGYPVHEEMALNHITYGNEPEQCTVYSYAAMIAEIPPFMERQELIEAWALSGVDSK